MLINFKNLKPYWLISLGTIITIITIFVNYPFVAAIGVLLISASSIVDGMKYRKKIADCDRKIAEYDKAFNTKREKDGEIESITIDCGTF